MFFLLLVVFVLLGISRATHDKPLEELVARVLKTIQHEEKLGYTPGTHDFTNQNQFLAKSSSFYSCVKPGYFALTFDDGPFDTTESILDILKKNSAVATFFIVGSQAQDKKSILRRINREGHTVAAHSWSHTSFFSLSDKEINKELTQTEDVIYAAIHRRPALFRPPYGDIDDHISEILEGRGYQTVMWNLDTKDWSVRTWDPYQIYSKFKEAMNEGSPRTNSWISLQHDFVYENLDYLGKIIKLIRTNGYEIVDMATCLGIGSNSVYQDKRRKSSPEGELEIAEEPKQLIPIQDFTAKPQKENPISAFEPKDPFVGANLVELINSKTLDQALDPVNKGTSDSTVNTPSTANVVNYKLLEKVFKPREGVLSEIEANFKNDILLKLNDVEVMLDLPVKNTLKKRLW